MVETWVIQSVHSYLPHYRDVTQVIQNLEMLGDAEQTQTYFDTNSDPL